MTPLASDITLTGRETPDGPTHANSKRRSLSILMVAARYLPFSCGTEMHIKEVAGRLAAQGHDVTVLTCDPTHKLPARELLDGVRIERVRGWPLERDYCFAPGMMTAIVRGQWDVIHVQGYHTFFAPMAMLTAIARRIPFVITFHSGGHSNSWRTRMRGMQWPC